MAIRPGLISDQTTVITRKKAYHHRMTTTEGKGQVAVDCAILYGVRRQTRRVSGGVTCRRLIAVRSHELSYHLTIVDWRRHSLEIIRTAIQLQHAFYCVGATNNLASAVTM